jgi:hypothetical protein
MAVEERKRVARITDSRENDLFFLRDFILFSFFSKSWCFVVVSKIPIVLIHAFVRKLSPPFLDLAKVSEPFLVIRIGAPSGWRIIFQVPASGHDVVATRQRREQGVCHIGRVLVTP